eukprot:916446-Amphidinium_carterae.1
MPDPLPLQDQVDRQVGVLPPYLSFLSLSEMMNAASPTDFRKNISAMGGESTGFTTTATQTLGAVAVRTADTSVKMVSIYRKLLKNELAARLVLEAGANPAGGTTDPNGVDTAGLRWWRDLAAVPVLLPFVAAQDYPVGGGRPYIAPPVANGAPVGLTADLIRYLLTGTLGGGMVA